MMVIGEAPALEVEASMRPGEVVVARLREGVAIGRCLAPAVEGSRVRMALGRNRQTQLPADRIILATGIAATGEEEVEEFRRRCEALASDIDLAEVWELLLELLDTISSEDLADLYWGPSPGMDQRVALLLHLDRASLYFVGEKGGYTVRTRETVREIQTRRQREAENEEASASLITYLSEGRLPPELTSRQSALLGQLQEYVIHGESYTCSAAARSLLEKMGSATRDLQQLGFGLLVRAGVFSPDEHLALKREGIPQQFPPDALEEAATIDLHRALAEPLRRDLTAVPTVTVDDEGATDRDDAISLEIEEDPAGTAGTIYRIGVHITDVGAMIQPGGAIDREAERRMASLYLPDLKVPMLPPEVSQHTGSIVPGERRLALSLLARVGESGEVADWEVAPSVISSRAALSYEEAGRAIEDADDPWHSTLAPLHRVAGALRRRREEAGGINLEQSEMLISVTPSGEAVVRVLERSTPGRVMVTELMILCNALLAEFCREHQLPACYRSQVAPDISDVMATTPEGPLRRYLAIRRFPPADLDTIPARHGGLGLPVYIQATSPLRRYPDLVMQRQLSSFLSSGQPRYSTEDIASVAQRAEVQLRELARLEEDRRRYWFLKYLENRLSGGPEHEENDLYRAVVLECRPGQFALLELADYPFRVRVGLPENRVPGDEVVLRLHGVDLWRRSARFVHESTVP